MEWEDMGRAAGKFFLAALEYSFKLCAIVAAAIAIGSKGALSDKITHAFGMLSMTLRQMVEVPGKLMEMGTVIHDYNTQSASVFTEMHGIDAAGNLLYTLNKGIEYFIGVYENFSRGPLATLTAMLLVFLTFYVLAWVLRFARQKGQGSFLVRLERSLAERIFGVSSPAPAGPSAMRDSAVKQSKPASNGRSAIRKLHSKVDSNGYKPKPRKIKRKATAKPKSQFKKRTKKPGDDFAPDSETLTLMLEAARSS